MPALTEPVAADLASALRGVVLSFKAGESRRRFAPVLHVGDPTGEHITHAVRADLETYDALRATLEDYRARMHTNEPVHTWD